MAKQTPKDQPEDEEESSSQAAHDEDEADESEESEQDSSEEDDSSETDEQSVAAKASLEKASVSDKEEEDEESTEEEEQLAARSLAVNGLEEAEEDEGEEPVLATQLGMQRYIFAGYFVGGMLMAYVLGRAIHGIWSHYANRDFFVSAVPRLAAIPDESKQTYATVVASLITLVVIIRTYRKPDVKRWTEEVTSEMTKVKWPSRKEVTNSTIVVITASAIATTYLFLLDRLWAFVTGLVYGAGT